MAALLHLVKSLAYMCEISCGTLGTEVGGTWKWNGLSTFLAAMKLNLWFVLFWGVVLGREESHCILIPLLLLNFYIMPG